MIMKVTRNPPQVTYTHYANEFNSTEFTNCCGLAVSTEKECPGCKARVIHKTIKKG